MKKERLQEIIARSEAATHGPWELSSRVLRTEQLEVIGILNDQKGDPILEGNADFITHSRSDISELIEYIKELEEINPTNIKITVGETYYVQFDSTGTGVGPALILGTCDSRVVVKDLRYIDSIKVISRAAVLTPTYKAVKNKFWWRCK